MHFRIDSIGREFSAIGYVLYEGCYEGFFDDQCEFVRTAAIVLGRGLCSYLGFHWCEIKLPSGMVIGARSPYNNIIVPLEARVASKLSELPDWDSLWDLILDIYLAGHFPEGCHYLAELAWESADEEHFRVWKFEVPPDIQARVRNMIYYDRDMSLRLFGPAAWDFDGEPNWVEVRAILFKAEQRFSEWFREKWKPDVE